jgi:hypothetical protein
VPLPLLRIGGHGEELTALYFAKFIEAG